MTEDEARDWLGRTLTVSRETWERLESFAAAVIAENARQNLISAATIPQLWSRHIVDSAQLIPLAESEGAAEGRWLDLGTGAGFPGMIVAILSPRPVTLIEARRKRHEFLARQAEALGLAHVEVHGGPLESLKAGPAAVISARAFAPLPRLFELAHRFSTEKTLWLLPKGRRAAEELESARGSWQGRFHMKPSLTDAEAAIIVATGLAPRKGTR